MARELKLLKTLRMNTEYKTEDRQAWIIERIGTDDTSEVVINIDKKEVLRIKDIVAPIIKSSSNLLGPLNLKDLYLVVPPETPIKCTGTDGKFVRIEGKLVLLEPGEKLMEPYIGRFYGQTESKVIYKEATFSLGTDVVWGKDSEQTVLTIEAAGNEKYVFDDVIMIEMTGGTFSYGDFALVIYKDGVPLENIWEDIAGPGVDIMYFPRPPANGRQLPEFLEKYKLEIEPFHKVEFKIFSTLS